MIQALQRLLVVVCFYASTSLGGVEVDKVNCAAQIVPSILSQDRVAELQLVLVEKWGTSHDKAASLVRALRRRLAFFQSLEAGELLTFQDILSVRSIKEMDLALLVADLSESLPMASVPNRSRTNRSRLALLEDNPGLSYLLDVLTLPAEAAKELLEEEDVYQPKPIYRFHPQSPLIPASMDRSESQAKKEALSRGYKCVMRNQNGTFTPVREEPLDGAYFGLDGRDMEPGSPPERPPYVTYFVVDNETGDLTEVDHEPTEPNMEYLVFGIEGLYGPVIGHGITEGGVNLARIKNEQVNLLVEEWKRTLQLDEEITVAHRIALFTILDRLAVDTMGISDEVDLRQGRARTQGELLLFLEGQYGRTFLDCLFDYVKANDPLRAIKSREELPD